MTHGEGRAAPLAGLRVVVTRPAHQAAGLAAALRAAGARAEPLPLLEVVPPADPRPLERAASELPLYHWLAFTSANAVEAFLPLTGGALPPRLEVAAVGRATAAALREHGVEPRLIPARGDAEGLARELAPRVGRRRRVLLPQAADARPALADGLTRAGAEVVAVTAYDKRLPAGARERARELFLGPLPHPLGWVTFTSPRIARAFVELLTEILGEALWRRRRGELKAAAIGRVTAEALADAGIEPAARAREPSDAALTEAIVEAVARAAASR